MDVSGVDLSMLIKLVFVFEGVYIWKVIPFERDSITQNIEFEFLLSRVMNDESTFQKKLAKGNEFKIYYNLYNFLNSFWKICIRKTPFILAIALPIIILALPVWLGKDLSSIGKNHLIISAIVLYYMLFKVIVFILCLIINNLFMAKYTNCFLLNADADVAGNDFDNLL